MISRKEFIDHARTFIGVPYKDKGRNRKGVDCGGLIAAIVDELGAPITIPQDYERLPNPKILINTLENVANKYENLDLTPGNIVLMEFQSWAGSTHVAILTDHGLLHSYMNRKKVVEHAINRLWQKRIKASYLLRCIDG